MLLKFLEKPLVVDCFISEKYEVINEVAPIQPAYKFFPDWFKFMEPESFNFETMSPENNIKSCQGFLSLYKHGFIIPMWSELAIKVTELGYSYQFADKKSHLEVHSNEQARGFYSDHMFMKIISPWIIDSHGDVDFFYSGCQWNHTKPTPYITPNGIVKYNQQINLGTHIFLIIQNKKQNISIDFATPMLHLTPLTEKKVELNRHVITEHEYEKRIKYNTNLKFNRKSINMKRVLEGKCPLRTRFKE